MKYFIFLLQTCFCLNAFAQSSTLQLFEYGIKKNKQKVELYWAYPCGVETAYFIVEKSQNTNMDSAVYVGRVEPVCNGNLTYYSLVDTQAFKGISYYRVKAFNGLRNEFSYAYWQQIAFPLSEDSFFSIYPNPISSGNILYFNWENAKTESVFVEVLDMQGRKISQIINDDFPQGIYQKEYNTSNLPSGIYVLSGWVGQQFFQQKFIK
jgi:Secretion system C-terminal sorting domain